MQPMKKSYLGLVWLYRAATHIPLQGAGGVCGVLTTHTLHVTRNKFPPECDTVVVTLSLCHWPLMAPGGSGQLSGPGESPATAWAQLTPCLLVATGHLYSLQSLHNPVTTNSPSPLCLPVTDSEPVWQLTAGPGCCLLSHLQQLDTRQLG